MSGKYREENIRVRHHQCDTAGKLKLHFLMDLFQDAAAEHADVLGFGMNDLKRTGMIWVLSRLKITVNRMPVLGEMLAVETYPTGMDRLFATRQYAIYSDSELLVKGTSAWLVLEKESYQIMPPEKVLALEMPRNDEAERFHPLPGKIRTGGITSPRRQYRISHADIDLNDHLNNAVYARYLQDLFDQCPDFETVQFNFLRSGMQGENIDCGLLLNDDGTFYSDGLDGDGKPFFQAAGKVR